MIEGEDIARQNTSGAGQVTWDDDEADESLAGPIAFVVLYVAVVMLAGAAIGGLV